MKNLKTFLRATTLLFIFAAFISCSSDDDSSGTPAPTPSSRNVKYTVTGTATGNFSIIYISATGGGTNETYAALPYSKEFTAQSNVPSVSFTSGVTGAVPGQTMTAKIFIGGDLKREISGVVDANGTLVVSPQSYIFE